MIDKEYYFALCRDAEANLEVYLKKAKSEVVRREYCGWKRYDTTPYWFERNLEPRSPVMDSEAAEIAYGFDENDRLCFIQSHEEECIDIVKGRLMNRRYRNGKVDSIEELIFENNLPVKYVEFIVRNGMNPGNEWHFEEEYFYDDKILVKIKRTEYWYAGGSVRSYDFEIEYNEIGIATDIKKNGAVIFSNISMEQARDIREEVKKGLIVESVNAIKRIGENIADDLVCFIGIYLHDEPHGPIDPIFHPALQSIRDEQIKAEDGIWTLWNAGEHPVQYQEELSDDNLKRKFQLLMQYWQYNSDWSSDSQKSTLMHKTWWGESKALWQEVAMELNQINWNGIIPTTETFVIFADEEGLDVAGGDLEKSVPATKISTLEREGLLSR